MSDVASSPTVIPILIPFRTWDSWTEQCVRHCAALEGPACALWLLPDAALPATAWGAARLAAGACPLEVLPTGPVNPARKRNVALRRGGYPVMALIDADAYPRKDWLANAIACLSPDTGIVAGPNLTPPEDPWLRQLPGLVMSSPLGFGAGYLRHTPVPAREIDEMPTCNMIIRVLPDLFFREDFATAEDMMYCRDVIEQGFKIRYEPEVVVFHHRRKFGREFVRQFHDYGFYKGRLLRQRHPSSRLGHALPAGLLLYFMGLVTMQLIGHGATWMAGPALLYLAAILTESVRLARDIPQVFGGLLAFPTGHFSYGWGYLTGLLQSARAQAGP